MSLLIGTSTKEFKEVIKQMGIKGRKDLLSTYKDYAKTLRNMDVNGKPMGRN